MQLFLSFHTATLFSDEKEEGDEIVALFGSCQV